MSNLSRAAALTLFFCFFSFSAKAANNSDVVINEIAWMGSKTSSNDEWIELYNNTNSQINLADWKLIAKDGTPKINLAGIIPANGFYLLKRTNDETVPEIPADQIYNGALENNGEDLELYDNLGNLIDSINCSSGWFSGGNQLKQTMERKNPLSRSEANNWQTSQNQAGTPKARNSNQKTEDSRQNNSQEEKATENGSLPSSLSESQIIYPTGVVINEILPSPEGPDEENEWIEIFNRNSFEADLSGWKIKDVLGKTNTFVLPTGTKISAFGFLVFPRPITKIVLNNDNDGVSLIQPNDKVVETISYSKAPQSKSYSRVNTEWVWVSELTPGTENIPPKTTVNSENEGTAAVSQLFTEIENKKIIKSFPVLFVALTISLFSGILILLLKKMVKTAI